MAAKTNSRQFVQVRPVRGEEFQEALAVINSAARAYIGKIPPDCWHEPYMTDEQLRCEVAAGVHFSGIAAAGELVAVMAVQRAGNVHLVRHAYVLPDHQSEGLGGRLMEAICGALHGQILVGTWRAAEWAIRFYQRYGFELVSTNVTPLLLQTYWNIPERQIATSEVLARPALNEAAVRALVAGLSRFCPTSMN